MKKIFKQIIFLLFFMVLFPAVLIAQDFGLLLNQYADFNASDGENQFEYKVGIMPRFSKIINDNNSFFISATASFNIRNADDYYFVPELLRAEYTAQFDQWGFRLGRFLYSEPLEFIAKGLFDGLQVTHTSSYGRLGLGAWYTGFQYKKTANITMTEDDKTLYYEPIKFNETFAETYFASNRILASLDYEHLAIGEFLRLNAAAIGQFDLNKTEDVTEKLNSQYFILKLGIPTVNFLFELGGCFSAMQSSMAASSETDSADNTYLAFAGDFGIHWTLPTALRNKLSLNVRLTSGLIGEPGGLFNAFVPVTNSYFGDIFQARMTSLSVFNLNFTGRLTQSLGASFNVSYFMRHDKVTNNSFPVAGEGEGESLLGAEFFARFIWSLYSDLQFNLGGGVFIPALGNNWPDEKPVWRIDLSVILAIF